jgi:ATP-binding cassette, subfamily B, bacterial MsbA
MSLKGFTNFSMKIFFRILRYAPRLNTRLAQFFVFAVLGVLFQAVYLGLLGPLIEILFEKASIEPVPYPEVAVSFDFVKAYFQYHYINVFIEYGPMRALLFICLLVVVFVFLSNIFRYLERMTASKVKVDVVKNIRMHIFERISLMHIGFFNDQRKGDLISRFTNDVSEVEGAVVNGLKSVFKEPITLLVFITILFTISVKLTLFTLLVLPITGGIISEIVRRLKKKAKLSQETMGRIVNILDETFGGMRVINAFNARNFLLRRIDRETTYHKKVNLSISRKNELASPISEFLGVLVVAGILYYGGHLVLGGGERELEPEVFLVFLTIYANMIQPAKSFSNGITSLQKGTMSAQRIFALTDLEPEIRNKPGAIPLKDFKSRIEFENVSFAYDKDHVLSDISLTIEKGKTIALVGPSGGGKSTLADLIPRFYDPSSGTVKLDGIPLTDYELESLRRMMGVVTQESILFNDTIFNNIAFGMENMREEDVIQAARVANAHDFIMQTEEGYQTMIGERGGKLSGGQRQRISIARAVLKNPPILILDEATSALDSESERLVQEALTNLMQNRTSVVIAHRLSTIQHADEIIVVQDGRIVERGRHDELISQRGLYRKLSEIQKA